MFRFLQFFCSKHGYNTEHKGDASEMWRKKKGTKVSDGQKNPCRHLLFWNEKKRYYTKGSVDYGRENQGTSNTRRSGKGCAG